MEEVKKDEHAACWSMGCMKRHMGLRWILGLVILTVVFALGIKVGQFKTEFRGGNFGSRSGYGRMMYRGGGYPQMMGGYYYGNQGYAQPGTVPQQQAPAPVAK